MPKAKAPKAKAPKAKAPKDTKKAVKQQRINNKKAELFEELKNVTGEDSSRKAAITRAIEINEECDVRIADLRMNLQNSHGSLTLLQDIKHRSEGKYEPIPPELLASNTSSTQLPSIYNFMHKNGQNARFQNTTNQIGLPSYNAQNGYGTTPNPSGRFISESHQAQWAPPQMNTAQIGSRSMSTASVPPAPDAYPPGWGFPQTHAFQYGHNGVYQSVFPVPPGSELTQGSTAFPNMVQNGHNTTPNPSVLSTSEDFSAQGAQVQSCRNGHNAESQPFVPQNSCPELVKLLSSKSQYAVQQDRINGPKSSIPSNRELNGTQWALPQTHTVGHGYNAKSQQIVPLTPGLEVNSQIYSVSQNVVQNGNSTSAKPTFTPVHDIYRAQWVPPQTNTAQSGNNAESQQNAAQNVARTNPSVLPVPDIYRTQSNLPQMHTVGHGYNDERDVSLAPTPKVTQAPSVSEGAGQSLQNNIYHTQWNLPYTPNAQGNNAPCAGFNLSQAPAGSKSIDNNGQSSTLHSSYLSGREAFLAQWAQTHDVRNGNNVQARPFQPSAPGSNLTYQDSHFSPYSPQNGYPEFQKCRPQDCQSHFSQQAAARYSVQNGNRYGYQPYFPVASGFALQPSPASASTVQNGRQFQHVPLEETRDTSVPQQVPPLLAQVDENGHTAESTPFISSGNANQQVSSSPVDVVQNANAQSPDEDIQRQDLQTTESSDETAASSELAPTAQSTDDKPTGLFDYFENVVQVSPEDAWNVTKEMEQLDEILLPEKEGDQDEDEDSLLLFDFDPMEVLRF